MRITITGSNGVLSRAAILALRGQHAIRAVDTRFDSALPVGVDAVTGDIRDRDFAGAVTDGAEAVLHLAPLAAASMNDADVIDSCSRGSYNLADMAIEQGVRKFVVGSTLDLMERYPANWRVDEGWRPRPSPVPAQLACWLAEQSMRECCHTAPIRAIALRFDHIVTDAEIQGRPFDARRLHIEDAVRAIQCALAQMEDLPSVGEWNIYHISSGERARIAPRRAMGRRFGYIPAHDFAGAEEPIGAGSVRGASAVDSLATEQAPAPGTGALEAGLEQGRQVGPKAHFTGPDWRAAIGRPRRDAAGLLGSAHGGKPRVVIFGSAGPVAAALAEELQHDYVLRQTDARALADVREANKPQGVGAPLPTVLDGPHEERIVDVRDYAQVLDACTGMDAIVNCTVVRPHAVEAFRVNTLGAYNVAKAAAELGIKRIVHTGPQLCAMDERTGYWWDYEVTGDAPPRPGRNLYAHSKFLGNEITRVYAEHYGMQVPVLVYMQFLNPELPGGLAPMAVSWSDSARALRAALEVPMAPGDYEEVVITNDLPHGRYSARRAWELLGWVARDDISHLWER